MFKKSDLKYVKSDKRIKSIKITKDKLVIRTNNIQVKSNVLPGYDNKHANTGELEVVVSPSVVPSRYLLPVIVKVIARTGSSRNKREMRGYKVVHPMMTTPTDIAYGNCTYACYAGYYEALKRALKKEDLVSFVETFLRFLERADNYYYYDYFKWIKDA